MTTSLLPRRVLCVGNEICHDDGVAFVIARRLRELAVPASIIEVGEFGLSCLEAFLGAAQVVVVDAIATGLPAGQCRLFENTSFIPEATCSVGHAISLGSMLELVAELAPGDVPRVSVVGIEAGDLSPFGEGLSPGVQAAVPEAVRLVLAELEVSLVESCFVRAPMLERTA
ncbi:MAG: hydrogenase maturation protease [Polyangiaceae bacterium]